MKKITLIRHAKSSWDNPSLRDSQRPLNKRGKRDAPFMSSMMAGRGWAPDQLISSPAVRAYTTAQHFAAALGREASSILQDPGIYEAGMRDILRIIHNLDDSWEHVALFGHNPTFTMVANHFQHGRIIDNVPTCGIVEIEGAQISHWSDFAPDTAQLLHFHYPKQYFS